MTTPAWRRYLTFWRKPIAQDVEDELRFHTTMRINELTARGLCEADARRAVAERLGDMNAVTDECVALSETRERHARSAAVFDAFRSDLRYALRGLRARPGFATAIIVTLALGIGANAAVFSVVDRLLFRTAPLLRDANRTHRLYVSYPSLINNDAFTSDVVSYTRLKDLSATAPSIERLAGYAASRVVVGAPEDGHDFLIAGVTSSFFDFFGAPPAIGRYFNRNEDLPPNGDPVAVLSYATWQAEYDGRDVLGARVLLGGVAYTVIGVAPPHFAGLWPDAPPAAFVPFSAYAASMHYPERDGLTWATSYDHGASVGVLFTRKPGVSVERMTAELTRGIRVRYGDGLEKGPADPSAIVASTVVERGPQQTTASKVAALVGAMALVVLLIAGANVANLLLARALRRRREIAVRLALGVSRRRLVFQLLTETFVLVVLGGVFGLIAARWGGPALRAMFVGPSADSAIVTDVRTLIFVGSIVVGAGLLTGLAPALQAAKLDVTHSLRAGAREGVLQRSRARAALLVVQGALSVLLLVAAGLFVRSLDNVRHIDLGYDVDSMLIVDANMRGVKLDSARSADLWNRLLERAQTAPGVERVALSQGVPFTCCASSARLVRPPELDAARFDKLPDVQQSAVTPQYFATLQTRIVRGRAIDSTDVMGAPRVVVVSNRLARTLWPTRDPIGQCLMLRSFKRRPPNQRGSRWIDVDACATVVGVAADIETLSLTNDPKLYVYFSYAQPWYRMNDDAAPRTSAQLAIRTRRGDRSGEAMRALLQREMPNGSYLTVTPYASIIDQEMRSWRLGATMFVAFGVLAMTLAAVGLYSVVSYNITQRTHEMGVRRALGARTGDVIGFVIKHGLLLGGVGVLLGAAIALGIARRIEPLLFHVSPHDPLVFAGVIATMLVVTLAASIIPARRAASVDPTIALRTE